ncbi:MAG: hypothetical protein ABR575_07465 [Actinomycetota bacterium]
MRRSVAGIAGVVVLSVLVPGAPAAACSSGGEGCVSGATMSWDAPYHKPGERAAGKATVFWGKTARGGRGTPAEGPYYAYLRPASGKLKLAPPEDPEAVFLGAVLVEDGPRRGGRVTLGFTVPQVAAGEHLVQVCNAGCKLGLGDLLDSPITIVTTDAEERTLMTGRLDRLGRGLGVLEARLARGVHRLRKALGRTDVKQQVAQSALEARLEELDAELSGVRRKLERTSERDGPALSTLAAGGVLMLIFMTFVRSVRPVSERRGPSVRRLSG